MKLQKQNITIIGDSISKGLYLDNLKPTSLDFSAVKIIEDKLGKKINNLSSFGQTLKRVYEKGVISNYLSNIKGKHNICVLWIGGNDADYNWKEVAQSPDKNHEPKTPLKEFENILDAITKQLVKKVKVVFVTLPPIDSKRYFNNVISKIANKDAILQFFNGDITNINRHQECYNTAILKIAKEYNCPVFDIRTELLLDRDYLSMLSEDGIHPSLNGQNRIAELVINKINENQNEK